MPTLGKVRRLFKIYGNSNLKDGKSNLLLIIGQNVASSSDQSSIKQYFSCTTNDRGIDKFTSRNDVVLSFNDCMQQASKRIPSSRKSRTYISLAASAGMRLLK